MFTSSTCKHHHPAPTVRQKTTRAERSGVVRSEAKKKYDNEKTDEEIEGARIAARIAVVSRFFFGEGAFEAGGGAIEAGGEGGDDFCVHGLPLLGFLEFSGVWRFFTLRVKISLFCCSK
ncbi:MAG: hypothetical protein A3G11_01690 [Candidatus Lloydbacteria bacterium RIFCSPLOWO2_12_FULL_51_9]|uniref:Uncharacterized protein n=1 Tax=Candidatus Lloydbacteria bacterium RIFCSPLOWO2_12_FULL_51_9 TaxID=1798669 RepID=A0A1G2DUE5_9BACT|nr:MAG: hypothetical protein A3G11_01690 [Candidatus Lloydbacteria bacterium RIFCSPLOWO2_12_FULL_51_9]